MARKATRRCPVLEPLEPMVLLSGFSSAGNHAGPVLSAADIHILAATKYSGTIDGNFTQDGAGTATSAPFTFNGQGTIKRLGLVTMQGLLLLTVTPSGEEDFTGTATLKTKHGKVNTKVTTTSSELAFTVTGGTKQYKGASAKARECSP